jgi:hypothetical protein
MVSPELGGLLRRGGRSCLHHSSTEQARHPWLPGENSTSIQSVTDPNTPIGEILKSAGSEGLVLETASQERYALLPLDEDVIDLLLERSPKFRADCLEIRKRMDSGQFMTQQEVGKQLLGE